jgi:hypothetical protein
MPALRFVLLLAFVAHATVASAVPPLVIGDVPTADKGDLEVYAGVRYQKDGVGEWQVPFTEFILGVSSWQEITVEVPYILVDGQHGFGDLVLGTKVMPLRETAELPGIALSFEWKLANASMAKGLGSGSMEFGFLLRSQKTWDWFTLIGNVGYAFVTQPVVDGVTLERQGFWFLGLAPEFALSDRFSLLSDLYWRTADVPGEEARLAADVGFQYEVVRHLQIQGSVGTSLRPDSVGGPEFRSYLGLHWVVTVF